MTFPHALMNPYVIGSLGLSAGSLISYLRDIPKRIVSWAERTFTCSIQVSNMEDKESYQMVRDWLSSLESAKKTRNMTAIWDRDTNAWLLAPAPGTHLVWLDGRPLLVNRHRDKPASDMATMRMAFTETITIRMFTRNKTMLYSISRLVNDYRHTRLIPDGMMRAYAIYYNDWNSVGNRIARPLDSVVLPSGQMERIKNDLERFWERKEWYREMGIPYRRGWLLQGVPGSGKTSIVAALAGHYKKRVFILSLSEPDLSDVKLMGLFSKVNSGSILLIEDIDAAFAQRDSKDSGVTFSGLLNALDGIMSPEGVVCFMTTNHPEKLDPALIRPGRIDQIMEFSHATDEQLGRLSERILGKQTDISHLRGKTIAEAQVSLLEKVA